MWIVLKTILANGSFYEAKIEMGITLPNRSLEVVEVNWRGDNPGRHPNQIAYIVK